MTYRAYVSQGDMFRRFLSIGILDEWDGQAPRILRDGQWESITPEGVDPTPTILLPIEAARALLDSLTRHFHGADDTRALRKDYDAERARVDKLIDMVGSPTVIVGHEV